MSRIYLIGFMGSGKSTHGRQLARKLGYQFVDMDQWIVERTGKKVSDIFSEHGESYFRNLEREAIQDFSSRERIVVATGGGAPCHANHMDLLLASGLTIYLQLTPAELLSRLRQSHAERPLLAGQSEEEMITTITDLLKKRAPFYQRADVVVEGFERVAERLAEAVRVWEKENPK